VTAILPAAVLPKLRKLIPLLAWDKGGEVVATAAISRTLRTANRGWHDLNAVLTEPRVVEREAPPRRGWRCPHPRCRHDAGRSAQPPLADRLGERLRPECLRPVLPEADLGQTNGRARKDLARARGSMNAETIARALGGTKTAGGWKAKCPAHRDDTPSLSISDGKNGTPVVYCHGGCKQLDVIAALCKLGLWPNGERAESPFMRRQRRRNSRSSRCPPARRP
jgi:hypothetical protein